MTIPIVRWVGQKDSNGCGIACLAMVTGKTYAEVASETPGRSFHNDGVQDAFMDALLTGWGFAVARRFVGTGADAWTPEPFADVHLCVVDHGGGNNHCVVMVSDGTVLDPDRPGQWNLSDYPFVVSVAAIVPINRRKEHDHREHPSLWFKFKRWLRRTDLPVVVWIEHQTYSPSEGPASERPWKREVV